MFNFTLVIFMCIMICIFLCTIAYCPFGHIARAAASEDHSRALRASTDRLPVDWRRQEADLVSPGFEQSRVISNHST